MTSDEKIDFLTNAWETVCNDHKKAWELNDDAVVAAWDEYCNEKSYFDDLMYDFDECTFDELFSSQSPIDIAKNVFFGNIQSWEDSYLYFDGYGNICSCLGALSADSPIMSDLHRFMKWLATKYIENENDLYWNIGLPDYDIEPGDDEQEV